MPTPFPRLDGSSWPTGPSRPSFAASTLYAIAGQRAFEPEAHAVADVVLAEVLPLLDLGAAEPDLPYMEQVCSSAAQVGAAVGLLQDRAGAAGEETDQDVVAALRLAADDLPAMARHQREVARFVLLCGFYLARTDPGRVDELTLALVDDPHPAVRPAPPGGPANGPASGPVPS